MKSSFTAVFLKTGKWYSAFALEIPGANTQGKTLKEAKANLKDAVRELLTANREIAEEELSKKKTDFIEEELAVTV